MPTGFVISGAAHALFVLLLLFGGLFARDRLPPVSVADVTMITEAQLAALYPPTPSPRVVTDLTTPVPPTPDAEEQEAPTPEDTPVIAALPAPTPAPEATPSEQPAIPAPLPEAEVSDVGPEVEAPPPPDDRPEALTESAPQPAPRVAPEPAAPSEPLTETAPQVVQETAPSPSPEPPAPEAEAAAPEEATTEIVTEAEETAAAAPAASPRPRNRPARPAPQPETEVAEDSTAAAIAAAVAEAASQPQAARPVPSGPPLNRGEREALRVAVQSCWVVDVGSRSADVTVTVGMTMTREGTVQGGQIRRVSATGGDEAAQRAAFDAARRAILRCQRSGFPLPVDKYDHWREIEMTFNPEGMRLK
ncbi:MAG: hypothetical protein HKO95_17275 [Rhodobacteraceae bacterium]|nr:hypothetical protein [Alphaproteobacteria bacterium]NNF70983.1 hypothetical protein [Paracoccaceae bacterium]NNK68479.1 hypothetical protein [Paracoccaceae bacterium]